MTTFCKESCVGERRQSFFMRTPAKEIPSRKTSMRHSSTTPECVHTRLLLCNTTQRRSSRMTQRGRKQKKQRVDRIQRSLARISFAASSCGVHHERWIGYRQHYLKAVGGEEWKKVPASCCCTLWRVSVADCAVPHSAKLLCCRKNQYCRCCTHARRCAMTCGDSSFRNSCPSWVLTNPFCIVIWFQNFTTFPQKLLCVFSVENNCCYGTVVRYTTRRIEKNVPSKPVLPSHKLIIRVWLDSAWLEPWKTSKSGSSRSLTSTS